MNKNLGADQKSEKVIRHMESEMKKSLMGAVIRADVEIKTDSSIQTITDHKLCSIINHPRVAAPL